MRERYNLIVLFSSVNEYAKEPSTTLGLEAARASAQFEANMATAYEWDAPIQTSHNSLRTPLHFNDDFTPVFSKPF